MKRLVLLASVAVVGLVGCGSSSDQVSYLPNAWGTPGYCYYLYSPYECYGHHSGVPIAMPLYWHERYAAYYDSPAYVSAYVPRSYRSTATTRARVFERTYSSAIKTSARSATWKGSNGKTVSGTKVSRTAIYGGGSARSTGFSGGTVRKSSSSGGSFNCSAVPSRYLVAYVGGGSLFAYGSSSSFSGGGRSSFSSSPSRSSYSGGSARSGSSSSSSRKSGSGRNC